MGVIMLKDKEILGAHVFAIYAPGVTHTVLAWPIAGGVKWIDLDGDETPHSTTAIGLVKYASALRGVLEHIEDPLPLEWGPEDEAAEARRRLIDE